MPLQQGHERRDFFYDRTLLGRLQGEHQVGCPPLSNGRQHFGKDSPQPIHRRGLVERVERLHDQTREVTFQPRNGSELNPMGFLVQAHPQAKVSTVYVEGTLHLHDRWRHKQQPPRVSKRLVLAENLAAQPSQGRSELNSHHAWTNRTCHGRGLLQPLFRCRPHVQDGIECAQIGIDPHASIHHDHTVILVGDQARDVTNVFLGLLGVLLDLGDRTVGIPR